MGQPNISDLIEAYIKAILEEQEQIEIRRSEIAIDLAVFLLK